MLVGGGSVVVGVGVGGVVVGVVAAAQLYILLISSLSESVKTLLELNRSQLPGLRAVML